MGGRAHAGWQVRASTSIRERPGQRSGSSRRRARLSFLVPGALLLPGEREHHAARSRCVSRATDPAAREPESLARGAQAPAGPPGLPCPPGPGLPRPSGPGLPTSTGSRTPASIGSCWLHVFSCHVAQRGPSSVSHDARKGRPRCRKSGLRPERDPGGTQGPPGRGVLPVRGPRELAPAALPPARGPCSVGA